ncbi:MAG: histidine kinase [Chloroflexota bacterium]
MSNTFASNPARLKPGPTGVIVIVLAFAAVAIRALAIEEIHPLLTRYVAAGLVYLVSCVLLLSMPEMAEWLKHVILGLASMAVLWALSLRPQFDFLAVLFLLLTYPVAIVFTSRMRWLWVFILMLLTSGSLIFFLGLIQGLALSLTTMAGEIVIPAFLIANHEVEMARSKSQTLLRELEGTHQQLELYAAQVEDLTAVQERNRLARELHDTVSQLIFSINLTTRSAQLLLKKDPKRVPEHLHHLQEMTTDALGQLRALITQLRPPKNS